MPPSTAAVGTPGLATNLRVGFPPRGLVDTIEIAAVERLPLRSAELIAPDGTATPASYLNVADSPSFATGQSDLGNTWRGPIDQSSQFPGLNAQNPQAGAAVFGDQQLLSMVSSAEIPLPDPVVYRREWQRYRIRLTFGTPPSPLESQQIPAPAPPPPTAAAPLGG
jgi:hypothetical protein